MRKIILLAVAAVFATVSVFPVMAQGQSDSELGVEIVRSPGAEQQVVRGDAAVDVVAQGDIRAASGAGLDGFLLLIKYHGKNYTCAIAANGQVQECNLLYW